MSTAHESKSPIVSEIEESSRSHNSYSSPDDASYNKNQDIEVQISQVSSLNQLGSNPFLDPKVEEHYRDIYEGSQYECRHEFDPHFTWSPEEEKKIVRKLDFRVALLACFMFVALQVDRGNLGQATSDGFLKDLKLTTNDYNTGNTIFLVAFLIAELPSQLISKRVGPDRWIPFQMIAWSVVAMSQAALKGKSGFYATRFLVGFLEGGFIPDIVLWLSYFYTSKELPTRLSWFWTTLSLTTIATSLLASGILRLRGVGGLPGWAWLFLIEGLFTLFIGISAIFLMVPSAVETKAPWRPRGWFNEREIKIVVNRVLRDDPSKGDMHNRQAITPKLLWKGFTDYDLWPVYIIGFFAYIPMNTLGLYLSINLRTLGFTVLETNLLGIPQQVLHIVLLIIYTWLTVRLNLRALVSLCQPIYTVPLLGVLCWWQGAMHNKWATYAVTSLILGNPYIHAVCVGWCSTNSNSVKSRTISASLYNIFCQLGGILSANIYRTSDLPLYKRGNKVLFAIAFILVPILLGTRQYYVWRNKQRDTIWDAMTEDERKSYIEDNKDLGNKRLDFRFVY
ncbi:hypothetical protein BABINDRAFT_161375 [Babjeviella inositovora NRRL Y-12698]|uniref:Major facilitator superfamily (MFS) profile domain-containing protein n=1 Tax=Babjeviella inositovora NRRL Y-12698 TaxID=984486 RepID=A0A1E3QU25_9ASCO|nr:uncharacterized protein BABINDRAFT_161375 [Babjeviella inositovora NRRL Y-12698]ODQ80437.1 hypothetical protein BABINDRAFT_161375 [Babjeviella inositovora NRRL Y-12698]